MCQTSAGVPPVSFRCLSPGLSGSHNSPTFKFLGCDQTFSSVTAPFHGPTRNAPTSLHPLLTQFSSSLALANLVNFEQLLLSVDGLEHYTASRLLLSRAGEGVSGENWCWSLGLAPVASLNPALWGNWAFVHSLSVLLGGVFGWSGWGFPQDVLPGGEAAAAHTGDAGFHLC